MDITSSYSCQNMHVAQFTIPYAVIDCISKPLQILSQAAEKTEIVEELSASVSRMLNEQNLTARLGEDLERLAYAVNDGIRDGELRNMHILAAV